MSLLSATLVALAGAVAVAALLHAADTTAARRAAEDRADAADARADRAEAAACRPVQAQVIRVDTARLNAQPRTYTLDELERGL